MAQGKVILCVALTVLLGLGGAAGQSNSTQPETAKEIPVTEAPPTTTTSAISEEAAELVTEPLNATRVLESLRAELARRRAERQQQQQLRREQILRSLESLSERKREYELNRQEALQDAEASREARRLEMEARRVGRLPVRERERYNRARLEQLTEQTPEEENEIGDSFGAADASGDGEEDDLTREVASEAVQRVRNLLLIEEANGNLRLIDLDTEEGQQIALEGGQAEGGAREAVADGEGENTAVQGKRKLKIGQI